MDENGKTESNRSEDIIKIIAKGVSIPEMVQ